MSERNHLSPGPSDAYAAFSEPASPADPERTFREGLPPAFRMRADAHYVEQLDGALPAVTIQHIAVQVIDMSDSPADAIATLVESIKRHGVLEPLVVQRNNGTYKTITGQQRLAAARAAGLREVPCLVHLVTDERAQALRDILRPYTRAPAPPVGAQTSDPEPVGEAPIESVLDVAIAAMRLVGSASDANVSVVKTASGARLSIDLPFDPAQP